MRTCTRKEATSDVEVQEMGVFPSPPAMALPLARSIPIKLIKILTDALERYKLFSTACGMIFDHNNLLVFMRTMEEAGTRTSTSRRAVMVGETDSTAPPGMIRPKEPPTGGVAPPPQHWTDDFASILPEARQRPLPVTS